MPDGGLCRASAIRGQLFCYMHDPERSEDAAEARRLGGFRRRRERTLGVAYEIGGVRTSEDLLRIVEIALFDLLGAEASITRARALLHAALVGTKVLETGDLEARVALLESRLAAETG
jgi:hypothetical protein